MGYYVGCSPEAVVESHFPMLICTCDAVKLIIREVVDIHKLLIVSPSSLTLFTLCLIRNLKY